VQPLAQAVRKVFSKTYVRYSHGIRYCHGCAQRTFRVRMRAKQRANSIRILRHGCAQALYSAKIITVAANFECWKIKFIMQIWYTFQNSHNPIWGCDFINSYGHARVIVEFYQRSESLWIGTCVGTSFGTCSRTSFIRKPLYFSFKEVEVAR